MKPIERNIWVLILYGEETPEGEIVGEIHVGLKHDLQESLSLVAERHPECTISVRNSGFHENSDVMGTHWTVDFTVRNETEDIGEMEYWPEGYNPRPMSEIMKDLLDAGIDIEIQPPN